MTNEYSITLNFYQRPKIIMDYKIFLKKIMELVLNILRLLLLNFNLIGIFFFFLVVEFHLRCVNHLMYILITILYHITSNTCIE